jgi:hypothetical protein
MEYTTMTKEQISQLSNEELLEKFEISVVCDRSYALALNFDLSNEHKKFSNIARRIIIERMGT